MNNLVDKNVKQNDYVYTNKRNDKQIQIVNNNIVKSENENWNLENEYKYLNLRINKIFDNLFDYYNRQKIL